MNKLKKVFYSVFKIEKYPEMASQGTKEAVLYLSMFAIIVAVITCVITIYQLNESVGKTASFIEQKIPDFQYKDNVLAIQNDEKPVTVEDEESPFSIIILDDTDKTDEEIEGYKNTIKEKGDGLLFLKDKFYMIVKNAQNQEVSYTYSDFASQLGLGNELSKTQLLEFLQGDGMKQMYLSSTLSIGIYAFIQEMIGIIIYVAAVAAIGYVIAMILRVKMKYKAVFNMAAYAFTLSTILKIAYILLNTLAGYTISLFPIMYIGVACIYLIAALFITRVDLMKTQEELTRIKETQKEVEKKQEKEKQKEEEESKNDVKDNKEENKKKKETQKKEPAKKKTTKRKTTPKSKQNKGGEPEGSSV